MSPSELRILMVCPQFRPSVGGYERAAERLACALAARGHFVDVVTERRDRAWPADERAGRIRIRRLPCIYRKRLHTVSTSIAFASFLARRGNRYDVIHVHQYGVHAAIAVMLAKLFGAPVVLKLTSSTHQGILRTLGGGSAHQRLMAHLHRRVDVCIAVSEATADEGRTFGIPGDRITIIPNGVDTSAFAPVDEATRSQLRESLGIHYPLTVLYLGRLSSEKNPLGLLRAWQRVAARVPSAELVFVGSGPEEAALAEAVQALGLSETVRLAGSTQDAASWYRASDLYVLPSHNEGFSNSLIEALACALPAVATRVSGSTDVFARAAVGELVEPGDEEGLADAICALLSDSARRQRCGLAARAVALEHYSMSRAVESIEVLYGSVVRRTAGAT